MTKLPTGRHTQAIKAAKNSKKKYSRNKALKSRAKTYIRKINEAIGGKDNEAVAKLIPEAVMYIDKAASKGAIHKNKASRMKSRISKKINRSKKSD